MVQVPIYLLNNGKWSSTYIDIKRFFNVAATISKTSIIDDNYDDLKSHIIDNQNIIE